MSKFKGRTILIVEDDYLVALDMAEGLTEAGAVVCGPVATVEDAIREIESRAHLDAALLDVNIRGSYVYPVADVLRQRQVPFLFLTGYDAASIDPSYAEIPRCEKPIDFASISNALFLRT
ncbi:response regulator [Pseudooceanicola algae]|nr:response regulator [Pseudooceanicola algae]